MFIRCDALSAEGFTHGFSTREGGVSNGPFASLNLADDVGDELDAVLENRRRFAQAVGFDLDHVFQRRQVHGRYVALIDDGADTEMQGSSTADALVTARAGYVVAVRTADCMPILLADPKTGSVAAVHAGWRGMVADVIGATVETLARRMNVAPARLIAVIGPHIRVDSFNVGEDVCEQLAKAAGGRSVVVREGVKPRVDLAKIAVAQLRRAGVVEARIHDVGGCTYREDSRFFSHRRDHGECGRHWSVIAAR